MTQRRYTEIPKRQKCVNKEEPYIGGTEDIIDDTLGKPQSEVNQDRIEDVATLDGKVSTEKQRAEGVEGGLNTRLQTVEQLAEISISGGEAQIATGADFTNPDAEKRAKIPTVGAIVDGLNDGIYDVSKRNPTAGPNSDGKFTLEYILSNADTLIPTGWKHGGMIISFVHSSDNKYVQYRYMLDDATDVSDFTNTDNWSFCGDDVLVENPEFIRVYTDKDNRILWAIKADGDIYYGVGCPQQVKDYISQQISAFSDEKDIDKILAFLGNLINGNNLTTLLAEKLSADGLDSNALNTMSIVESPEWIELKTDSEGKIIEGIKHDKRKFFATPIVKVDTEMLVAEEADINEATINEAAIDKATINEATIDEATIDEVETNSIDTTEETIDGNKIGGVTNSEYNKLLTDKYGNIISSYQKNGTFDWKKGIPKHVQNYIEDEIDSAIDEYKDEQTVPFDSEEVLPLLYNLIQPDRNLADNTELRKQTTFLWFSDIHNNIVNMRRLINFYWKFRIQKDSNGNITKMFDNILFSGDFCGTKWPDYYGNNMQSLAGFNDILVCLGNHDTYAYYVTLTVNGISNEPSVGDVYKQGTVKLTLSSKSLSSGSGTLTFIQADNYISSKPGTITKVTGSGDSSISYTNYVENNAPRKEMYERYMRQWNGVVFPEGAGENNYYPCYYYKDYTDNNNNKIVRLIVLDGEDETGGEAAQVNIDYLNAENEWLQEVLTDALTAGANNSSLAVICTVHRPAQRTAENFSHFDCSFNGFNTAKLYNAGKDFGDTFLTSVDSFIESGGEFVCWLHGHVHSDFCGKYSNHNNQIFFVTGAAMYNENAQDSDRTPGTKNQDLFNVLSIDVDKKMFRIARFGCVWDRYLRHKQTISINYNTKSLISYY